MTFLRVLVEEAPRGECEELRTWVRGCRDDRRVVVIAAAQVRTGVPGVWWARVFVDIVAALARARDMFALMFAEVDYGGVVD